MRSLSSSEGFFTAADLGTPGANKVTTGSALNRLLSAALRSFYVRP